MAFGRGPRINIDSSFDDKGVKSAERSMNRLGNTGNRVFGGMTKSGAALGVATAGIGISFAALGVTLSTGVRELREAEEATAQVENRLKATGSIARLTAKDIDTLSSAIEKTTGIDGDQIKANNALLLSYTNIRGEVFKLASTLAVDLAVQQAQATGGAVNLKTAYTLVGKALNDPIKGMTALNRVGIQFTDQQKEQIKTLVDSGKSMKAQTIITKELERQVGGAGKTFGNTTGGQIEKLKRSYENLSAEITSNLLPALRATVIWLNTKLIPFLRDEGIPAMKRLGDRIARNWAEFMKLVNAVKAVIAAVRGVIRAFNDFLAVIDAMPGKIKSKGQSIGRSFVTGVIEGIRNAPGDIGGALADRLPRPGGGVPFVPGIARGGLIPGPRGAGDVFPAMLTPGEVVLNERQQSIVGPGRIMSALSRTGGRIGGTRFASGGVVGAAASRARRELGDPYGKPSRGESRTGPGSWDCSGYATYVAGVNIGGTTASAYSSSSRAKGSEPIIWGFRKTHSGGYRGGYDEHMGVRVGGTWFQTSGGRVAQVGSDGEWSELRVPSGLANLSGSAASGDGSETDVSPAQLARQKKSLLSQARALLSGPGGTGMSATDVASNSITSRHRDDSLQEKRIRANVGRAAAAMGITNPENIEARAEAEVLRSRLKEINADARDVKRASNKIKAAIAKAKVRRKKIYAQMRKTPARNQNRLQALKEAIANANQEIESMYDELWGLILQAKDLQAEAAELGYDIGQLAQEIANLPSVAAAEDASSATEAGVSADAQAQISQAQEATRVAQRASSLSAGFLRTVGSTGDLTGGSGGVLTVNFMSLYPGDPAVQAEMASWLTGVLGGQGSVPATQFAV